MKKTSNKRTRREMSTEQKVKIAASMKGKKHSAETRAKISARLKKYWETIPNADDPVKVTQAIWHPGSETPKPFHTAVGVSRTHFFENFCITKPENYDKRYDLWAYVRDLLPVDYVKKLEEWPKLTLEDLEACAGTKNDEKQETHETDCEADTR